MVDVDKAVVAKLEKNGKTFEILVDCDKALEFRDGKSLSLSDIVATDEIFKDVKQGEKASSNTLKETFNTEDSEKIAKTIIREGEIQLTTAHKAKLREQIKKQVINLIHTNAIDPKTGHPHPPQRIELAMDEAKVNIVEHKTAEDQVESILQALKPVLPISVQKKTVSVKIPAQYASQSFHILKKHGKLLSDKWENDGSLSARLEMPAGLVDQFFAELNNIAHGEVESKIE